MSKDIYAKTHCACNENGNESITIEYDTTFIQHLFKKQRRVQKFEKINGSWCYFGSNNEVTRNDWLKIHDVIEMININKVKRYRPEHSEVFKKHMGSLGRVKTHYM